MVHLSRLGFGVTGPHATALIPRDQTVDLIHAALSSGVTVFDTAPFYGDGEAERRLGLALAGGARAQAFITTKVGTARKGGRIEKDFTPDGIRKSLDASLERLGVLSVDAVFVHGPGHEALRDPLFAALSDLKTQGLAHAIGMCGRGDELDLAQASGVFDMVMAPAFTGQGQAHADRLQRWKDQGKPVLGIEVFAPARVGWRWPKTQADLWAIARAWKRRGAAVGLANQTVAECLDWALGPGGPDVALTMTTRMGHLLANIHRASATSLDAPAPQTYLPEIANDRSAA